VATTTPSSAPVTGAPAKTYPQTTTIAVGGDGEARERNALWLFLRQPPVLKVFYVYPLARLIPMSAGPPGAIFENYLAFFERPVYGTALFRTLYLSGLVTVCTVIAGFPTAYFLAQLTAQRAQLLMFFVLLPFGRAFSYALPWIVLLQPAELSIRCCNTGSQNVALSLFLFRRCGSRDVACAIALYGAGSLCRTRKN
jgi:ABC-type glycerol-3-phosphate transport system permease component